MGSRLMVEVGVRVPTRLLFPAAMGDGGWGTDGAFPIFPEECHELKSQKNVPPVPRFPSPDFPRFPNGGFGKLGSSTKRSATLLK